MHDTGHWGKSGFCVINPEPMVDKKDASKDMLLYSEFESLFDTQPPLFEICQVNIGNVIAILRSC